MSNAINLTTKEIETVAFTRPTFTPSVVLKDISDRQFFQQLAVAGLITQAEALAAVRTGDLPASIEAIVANMPSEDAQFSARMVLSGATTFQHSHPLVAVFRTAVGMTEEQFAQFWLAASKL